MNKEAILEGLLFVIGDEGLTLNQVMDILDITDEEAKELIRRLKERYQEQKYGIQITILGNSFKLTTKKEHKDYYQKLIENPETNALSQAALEILAIVAYNEPLTVQMVDEIRGVGSRETLRKLIAKGFIKEIGKSDSIGRPTLYGITHDFLDYFGLSSKDELPRFEDIKAEAISDVDLYNAKYKETAQ